MRTGDFIDALIGDAQDVDEYAFALGALGHRAADNDGHPMAVNRAVPLMYPKLKAQFVNRVTYAQSPKSHVMVEFSFDVVQVAAIPEMTKVVWSKKRDEIRKEFGVDYEKPHGFARFLAFI